MSFVNRPPFEDITFKIALRNGTYNFKTFQLEHTHRKDDYLLHFIDVDYNPKAKGHNFDGFLSEVAQNHEIPLIEEIFGYCLYPTYVYHKAFMLVGDGRNGKSTLLKVLREFLGRENVSSVKLHDIVNHRFKAAALAGKMANIAADISSREIVYTDDLKALTGGGDPIVVEWKGQQAFDLYNIAKMIFSANKVPAAKDDSVAWFDRWIFVNFLRSFRGNKAKNQDDLIAAMTTDEEFSNILNHAIAGLLRLNQRGGFNIQSTKFMKQQYLIRSNPHKYYLDLCPRGEFSSCTKDALYGSFKKWCDDKKITDIASKDMFCKEVKKLPYVTEIRPGAKNGDRPRKWRGIRQPKKEEFYEPEEPLIRTPWKKKSV